MTDGQAVERHLQIVLVDTRRGIAYLTPLTLAVACQLRLQIDRLQLRDVAQPHGLVVPPDGAIVLVEEGEELLNEAGASIKNLLAVLRELHLQHLVKGSVGALFALL